MRIIPTAFLLLLATPAIAEITMDAPTSGAAGAFIRIVWSGEGNPRDFITIVPSGTPEGKYKHYQYARKNQIDLRLPDDPGEYELRYLSAQTPYATQASQSITVTPVTATVEVAANVDAGAEFTVSWTGPDHRQDFIAIVADGAPERKWVKYAYTKTGSPAKLRAPDEPGKYEIRYMTGQKYYTLATATFTVGATQASVQGPDRVDAGAHFEVAWTGPDNRQDYISLALAGAEPKSHETYAYTKTGTPVTIRAPDAAGTYELRYMTGQSYKMLASQVIEVGAVTATLEAPERVTGGEPFSITWTGPDHKQDFLGLAERGGDDRARVVAWVYTHRGNPGTITAPLEAGEYDLRYQTGQRNRILARVPITVGPPKTEPGTLRVFAARGPGQVVGKSGAVELILDASGSMLKQQDGRRRIDIAREVLLGLTGETIPAGTPFAMRVFGHREADSCRTDLEVPLGPLDVAAAEKTIGSIQAMNLAKTPIARSLELVAQDLAGVDGERIVILITDGEETCDGDPSAAIEALKTAGMDVRVNIVGFAIDDDSLKETFRYWASLGGGDYHDAAGAADLGASMLRALSTPFDVINSKGEVVVGGLVGGDAVTLPAGDYTVRTRSKPPTEAAVVVVGGKDSSVTLGD